jgi:hypothetical protein
MGKQILIDCRIFTGGADLSAWSNKAELGAEVEEKDSTVFTSGGWKEVLGGLGSGEINAAGFWEAGSADKVDDVTWAGLGGLTSWTVCPSLATVGGVAYFMKAMQGDYKFGGDVGDIAPYEAHAKSAWPVVRGQIAHPPATPRTVTGVGSSVQLGAVPAGRQLHAALHVLSVAGTGTPTITARVESDNATGFPSPVTVATFTAATVPGGQVIRVPGPITDDWFRLAWTITGTAPSFVFVGALGIGP